jgi:hypothetical protein
MNDDLYKIIKLFVNSTPISHPYYTEENTDNCIFVFSNTWSNVHKPYCEYVCLRKEYSEFIKDDENSFLLKEPDGSYCFDCKEDTNLIYRKQFLYKTMQLAHVIEKHSIKNGEWVLNKRRIIIKSPPIPYALDSVNENARSIAQKILYELFKDKLDVDLFVAFMPFKNSIMSPLGLIENEELMRLRLTLNNYEIATQQTLLELTPLKNFFLVFDMVDTSLSLKIIVDNDLLLNKKLL